jgi:hypothetical protein
MQTTLEWFNLMFAKGFMIYGVYRDKKLGKKAKNKTTLLKTCSLFQSNIRYN